MVAVGLLAGSVGLITRVLLAALAATPISLADPAATRATLVGQGYVAVPLGTTDLARLRTVTMTVGGRDLRMVVSTGCQISIIDTWAAADLRLPVRPVAMTNFGTMNATAYDTAVPRYKVGGVEGGYLDAGIIDLRNSLNYKAPDEAFPIDGIIGVDFLTRHSAHLDLPGETLYLLPAAATETKALAGHWQTEGEKRGPSLIVTGDTISVSGTDHDGVFYFGLNPAHAARMLLYRPATTPDGKAGITMVIAAYRRECDWMTFALRETAVEDPWTDAPPDLGTKGAWKSYRLWRNRTPLPPPGPQPSIGVTLTRAGYLGRPLRVGGPFNASLVDLTIDGTEFALTPSTGYQYTELAAAKVRASAIKTQWRDVEAAAPSSKLGSALLYRYSFGGLSSGGIITNVADLAAGHDGYFALDLLMAHAAHIDYATRTLWLLPHNTAARRLLAGDWVCTSGESHDGPFSAGECAASRFQFEQNRFHLRTAKADRRFQFVTDQTMSPPGLVYYFRNADPARGVRVMVACALYKLEADSLTVQMNFTGANAQVSDAPKGFKANADWVVFHLARVKPASPDHPAPAP